jgi:hypothetical protein
MHALLGPLQLGRLANSRHIIQSSPLGINDSHFALAFLHHIHSTCVLVINLAQLSKQSERRLIFPKLQSKKKKLSSNAICGVRATDTASMFHHSSLVPKTCFHFDSNSSLKPFSGSSHEWPTSTKVCASKTNMKASREWPLAGHRRRPAGHDGD